MKRAIAIHPNYIEGLAMLGVYQARQQLMNESASTLEKALELDPTSELLQANLSVVLIHIGELDGAERLAREALASNPSNAAANFSLAAILASRGDRSNEMLVAARIAKKSFPRAAALLR